jgi:hypothetical protein
MPRAAPDARADSQEGSNMTQRRYIATILAYAIAATLLCACAAPGRAPVEPNAGNGPRSEPAQPTVFGKFDLLEEGKPITVSEIAWLGIDTFTVLVLPDGENRALPLVTDAHGWFAWRLKPGGYTLRAYTYAAGGKKGTSIGMLNDRFEVAADGGAIYIGHITVDLDGRRSGMRVRNDYEQAAQEFRRKYPQPASLSTRLLTPLAKLGAYSDVQSVCMDRWGVACTRDLQGVEPISPAVTRGPYGVSFTTVDGLLPELRWKSSRAPGVTYDVAIWEAAAYRLPSKGIDRHIPGHLVVYRENLARTDLALQTPLKPQTKYYWSVRLRRADTVSSWSRAGHFTFLVVAWTSSHGGWFGFATP